MLLSAGANSGTISTSVTIPTTLPDGITPFPTGTYYIIVRADGKKEIAETDENNNTRTLRITVK